MAPLVPLGLMFGRIGNFINGELWGRAAGSDVPWAMIFKNSGTLVPRHPSQLYEAFLEGALLFTVLWWFSSKPSVAGAVGSLFCMGYGLVRFIVEYFREPDSYLGLGLFGLSRGQWLSLPVSYWALSFGFGCIAARVRHLISNKVGKIQRDKKPLAFFSQLPGMQHDFRSDLGREFL